MFDEGIQLLHHFVSIFQKNPDEELAKNKYPSLYRGELIELTFTIMNKFLERNDPKEAERFCEIGKFINYYCSNNPNIQNELNSNKTHFSTKYKGYLILGNFYLNKNNTNQAKVWLNMHFDCLPHFESCDYNISYDSYFKFAELTNDFSLPKIIINQCFSFENYVKQTNGGYRDIVTNELEANLEIISENFYVGYHAVCPNLHHRNKKSISELDVAFSNTNEVNNERYDLASTDFNFKHNFILPELGAYFGEVLIKEFSGSWILEKNVLEAKVQLKNRSVNPFELAYMVVFYKFKLIQIFEELE